MPFLHFRPTLLLHELSSIPPSSRRYLSLSLANSSAAPSLPISPSASRVARKHVIHLGADLNHRDGDGWRSASYAQIRLSRGCCIASADCLSQRPSSSCIGMLACCGWLAVVTLTMLTVALGQGVLYGPVKEKKVKWSVKGGVLSIPLEKAGGLPKWPSLFQDGDRPEPAVPALPATYVRALWDYDSYVTVLRCIALRCVD
jgi:hypothetical protein